VSPVAGRGKAECMRSPDTIRERTGNGRRRRRGQNSRRGCLARAAGLSRRGRRQRRRERGSGSSSAPGDLGGALDEQVVERRVGPRPEAAVCIRPAGSRRDSGTGPVS